MNKLAKIMNKVWNNVSPREAHFGDSGEKEFMFSRYKELITDNINVANKIIIDYGCGGGLLGQYLLSNFKIKKYIAYDLSERSLNKAKENNKEFDNTEFNLVPIPHSWNFIEKNPDVIICLACIIHFPTQIYLNNFIKECNNSGAKWIVLEIRNNDKGTHFQKNPYSNAGAIAKACFTTPEYIKNILKNYKLFDLTERSSAFCEILTFKKNSGTIK